MVRRLRIHLPLQGTQAQALAGELRSHTPQDNKVRECQRLTPHTARSPSTTKTDPVCPKTRRAKNKYVSKKRKKTVPQNRVNTIPPKLTSMHLCSWEVNQDTWSSKSYKKHSGKEGKIYCSLQEQQTHLSAGWFSTKQSQRPYLSLVVSKLSEAWTKDTRDSYIHCPLPSCSESNGKDRSVKHGTYVQRV